MQERLECDILITKLGIVQCSGGKELKRLISFALCVILLTAAFVPASAANEGVYSNGATGETVVRIQLRLAELGYLFYKPTGAYRSMTVEAVKAFQQRCCDVGLSVAVDGVMGYETMRKLFSNDAPRAKIPDSVHIAIGPTSEKLSVKGETVEWNAVKPLLTIGESYEVTDCNTGKVFELTFSGGENHAEMELTSQDWLEEFMKICGGEFNCYKRPVVVKIGDKNIAASIQCYPHGSESLTENGMTGHICVFFSGSLSHVGNLHDVEHEANIKAAGQ